MNFIPVWRLPYPVAETCSSTIHCCYMFLFKSVQRILGKRLCGKCRPAHPSGQDIRNVRQHVSSARRLALDTEGKEHTSSTKQKGCWTQFFFSPHEELFVKWLLQAFILLAVLLTVVLTVGKSNFVCSQNCRKTDGPRLILNVSTNLCRTVNILRSFFRAFFLSLSIP
jgi:hypothetical protein